MYSADDIRMHCATLTQVLSEMSGFRDYPGSEEVLVWFQLASGVKRVDYDPLTFSGSDADCGMRGRFVEVQRRLQEHLLSSLTRFMFCWSGLECAVDHFISIHIPNAGKINKVCEYLRRSARPLHEIPGYADATGRLDASSVTALPNTLRTPRGTEPFLSPAGVGIWRVYNLRNKFAHGSLKVPVEDEDDPRVAELELVSVSTTIVLLTLQMIMIERFGARGLDVWWRRHGTVGVSFDRLLWWIHVEGNKYLPSDFDDW